MTAQAYIESIGQQVVTLVKDLSKTVACPRCQKYNLCAKIQNGDIFIVLCNTPIRVDIETNELEYCGFSSIVNGVDISRQPFVFNFSETRPPVKQKRTRAVRGTAPKPTTTRKVGRRSKSD